MINYFIIFLFGFISGLIIANVIDVVLRKYGSKVNLNTYAKLITTTVVTHGMILTTFSYVLSFFGRDPVVDISSTMIREIVAPVIVYLATNMIANIFEKNRLSFSVPLNADNYIRPKKEDEEKENEDKNLLS